MKITIEIPEEFESHFYKDKFSESFDRIIADIKLDAEKTLLAGNYEKEVIEMLKTAFEAVYIPECCADCTFFTVNGRCLCLATPKREVKKTDSCLNWRKKP